MELKEFKERLLRKHKIQEEFEKKDLTFEIAEMIVEARIIKGVTQKHLAEKMGTKQPSIARVENETYLPSLSFLEKMAEAFDTYLIPPRFAFMESGVKSINININLHFFQQTTNNILIKSAGRTIPSENLETKNNVARVETMNIPSGLEVMRSG